MIFPHRMTVVAALAAVFMALFAIPAQAAQPSTDSPANITDRPTTNQPIANQPIAKGFSGWLMRGMTSDEVRELQARLKQIGWFNHAVTGFFGPVTEDAVKGFQAKRGLEQTGWVNATRWDRLVAMTSQPTATDLGYQSVGSADTSAPLDQRCQSGRAICLDKTSQTLRWVVNGTVVMTLDARFGNADEPTREGLFFVFKKSRDQVSNIYGTPMPFSLFFSGGQAIHYSSDFATNGYNGASHGCVNVRNWDALAQLFDTVQLTDKVVVYRS